MDQDEPILSDRFRNQLRTYIFGTTDFKNTDWELYQPPVETFGFGEAIHRVTKGKAVRRQVWDRIYLRRSSSRLYIAVICPGTPPSDYLPMIEDARATDWYEVEQEDAQCLPK